MTGPPAIGRALLGLVSILALTPATGRAAQLTGGIYALSTPPEFRGDSVAVGGAFSLEGTLNEPLSGTLTAGRFHLDGHLWPATNLAPLPGGPTLHLALTGGVLTLAWDPPAPGFVLEQSDALGAPWFFAPSGDQNPVTFPLGAPSRFYRLARLGPSPDAPGLHLEASGSVLTLSWAPATPGFVLQQADALGTGWTFAASGDQNPVTLPAGAPIRFFRVVKP